MSSFPQFLKSYEDLEAHIDEFFSKLPNVEKGDRFAGFAARLVPFIPDLRRFGEATLSEKKSHDGGVDIVSAPLEDGSRLCLQSKLRLTTKEEIDTIISKFQAYETNAGDGPAQLGLFEGTSSRIKPTFGIISAARLDGIMSRYMSSAISSRPFYNRLVAEGRLIRVDGPKIHQMLQTAYGKTYGVPSQFKIGSTAPWIRNGRVWLGFVMATDLVDLYNKFGDGLFFENIRDYLGPTSGLVSPDQLTVNQEIADTISKNPDRFLERNNGVTMKARKVSDAPDHMLILDEGSIVNGCQTTMSLVEARLPLDSCVVQVKVVESEDAWDVAKSANYQNTVDKIELDLARFLRPQLIRRAASEFGIEVFDAQPTNAVALLGGFYDDKVQYEEVRYLYIGLLSINPNNIGDQLYTKLRPDLISAFASNDEDQQKLLSTLFKIALTTRSTVKIAEEVLGGEDYMKPFMRVFQERKPQYRMFLAILSVCAILRVDLSDRRDKTEPELARMKDFVDRTLLLLSTDPSEFTRTYLRAINTFANEARLGSDDDNRVRQGLSNLLKRGFRSLYSTLTMNIDVESKLSSLTAKPTRPGKAD